MFGCDDNFLELTKKLDYDYYFQVLQVKMFDQSNHSSDSSSVCWCDVKCNQCNPITPLISPTGPADKNTGSIYETYFTDIYI